MNVHVSDLLERIIYKVTSGRFIFTVVVAFVYAWLALHGGLEEERINEITLIVLYAYFNRNGKDSSNLDNDDEAQSKDDAKQPEKPENK